MQFSPADDTFVFRRAREIRARFLKALRTCPPPRRLEYLETRLVRVASEIIIIMRAGVTLFAVYYPDYRSPMRERSIVARETEREMRSRSLVVSTS